MDKQLVAILYADVVGYSRLMGQNGRTWMREEFGWDQIGRQMLESYEWLLGRSTQHAQPLQVSPRRAA